MKPFARAARPATSAPRPDDFTSYARTIDSAREPKKNGKEINGPPPISPNPDEWPRCFWFEGETIDIDEPITSEDWATPSSEGGWDE